MKTLQFLCLKQIISKQKADNKKQLQLPQINNKKAQDPASNSEELEEEDEEIDDDNEDVVD